MSFFCWMSRLFWFSTSLILVSFSFFLWSNLWWFCNTLYPASWLWTSSSESLFLMESIYSWTIWKIWIYWSSIYWFTLVWLCEARVSVSSARSRACSLSTLLKSTNRCCSSRGSLMKHSAKTSHFEELSSPPSCWKRSIKSYQHFSILSELWTLFWSMISFICSKTSTV